eukprot:TRINITY_DN5850_c0_g1_i3.p1 TRINITY_DN5850_c0_g1~~TRINITY_DN5850_c0_g1_i3.p1  ORF type:complete len:354 (+),score=65.97 TRINITY_DN5850_c0_g1_i3:51-1112(+)
MLRQGTRGTGGNALADLIRPLKAHIGSLPSPFQQLQQYSRELPAPLYVKRDDLAGSVLTGGAIRKLEFLLYDAKLRKATAIITYGSDDDEFVRTAVLAARQLGFDSYVFFRGEKPKSLKANLFLSQMAGAAIHYLPTEEWKSIQQHVSSLETRLSTKGEKPYFIAEGGASAVGAWGSIAMIKEILEESKLKPKHLHIVVPVLNGATLAGVLLARRLYKLDKTEVYGVCIQNNRNYYFDKIKDIIADFNKRYGTNYDPGSYTLWDQYQIPEKQDDINLLIKRVARIEGLLLDPLVTGRAFYALSDQLTNNSMVVGGKSKVVFIHSGGLFTLLNQKKMFADIGSDQNLKEELFQK